MKKPEINHNLDDDVDSTGRDERVVTPGPETRISLKSNGILGSMVSSSARGWQLEMPKYSPETNPKKHERRRLATKTRPLCALSTNTKLARGRNELKGLIATAAAACAC